MARQTLAFTKMHGLGNDFVVLDQMDRPEGLSPSLIHFLADRRLGVGCDQVIILRPPTVDVFDFRMVIYNADGSQAEMCGNAARCVARYMREVRTLEREPYRLETGAGLVQAWIQDDGQVAVDMGVPEFRLERIPATFETSEDKGCQCHLSLDALRPAFVDAPNSFWVTPVSMGNPHCVMFESDVERFPVEQVGPEISRHPAFPNQTNVEFAQILDRKRIRMRVYERGAGVTPACGTGACATLAAAAANGFSDREADIILDGGVLHIQWTDQDRILMTGPAETSFQGSVDLGRFN